MKLLHHSFVPDRPGIRDFGEEPYFFQDPLKGLTHCLSMEMRITDFEFQTARSPSSEGVESSYLDTNSVSIDILKI